MGYTTEFKGTLSFDKPLTSEQVQYIQAFNSTRRMKRDANISAELPDPLRLAVGLPIGEDGAYFVGSHSDGNMGQNNDKSVLDHNESPGNMTRDEESNFDKRWNENKRRAATGLSQPGLWCGWTVSDDGTKLEWDGGEKFYYYTEWLKYLIDNFFAKWGANLNGTIKWRGEDFDDTGSIIVTDNKVTTA